MIRFIDLRNQGTGKRFAFWSTSGDHFIRIDGEQAWNTVAELKEAWESAPNDFPDIARLVGHCENHPWTAEGEDDVVAWYTGETDLRRDIEEFSVVWFEQTQKWVVLLPDGTTINRNFGAIGYATAAVHELTGRGEAEFECVETGDFFRFVKDEEHWSSEASL